MKSNGFTYDMDMTTAGVNTSHCACVYVVHAHHSVLVVAIVCVVRVGQSL